MRHSASPRFWACYAALPPQVRPLADQAFIRLKVNPSHPSLHLKKIGEFRSVRIGLRYRALAVEIPDGLLWFWIGNPTEYDRLVG